MKSLPEIGDVVDDTYELVSILGSGGFGAVYRARQINMDRDVALKLLIASGPKFEEMVKRFRREVMAIRNLTHPNTVRIYDFRDDPEGLLYYTMEALDGKTLKQEVRQRGPLSPQRLHHVLLQVLKSLSEAHAQNIVHRDLKPANIMLVDMHGETDFVKVLDFGIAKLLHEDEDVEELTSAGILVGTLRYMAPEQIAGDDLGPYTDLYALGLIAVEMLTGASVFTGTGRWEVLQQQISDEPVRIPQAVLDTGLGPIIRRCLQKDRAKRYNGADEVIQALRSIDNSQLDAEPLYVSDGGEGWVPRGAEGLALGSSAEYELDSMNTVMIEERLDDRTDISEERPVHPDEHEKTIITDGPFGESEPQGVGGKVKKTVPMRPSLNKRSPAASAPPAVPQPPSMPGEGKSGSDLAARQEQALRGSQLAMSGFEVPKKSGGSKNAIIAAVVVLLIAGGGGVWMAMSNGDDDEPGGDDVQLSQDSLDEESQPEVAGLDEEKEEVSEVRTFYIDVENSGLRATVYLDDELRSRTPYRFDLEEGEEALLRLEARDHEDMEIVVSWDSDEELSFELEPIEEVEEEEDETVADRSASSSSPSGSRGTQPRRSGSRGTASRPSPRPAPQEPDDDDDDDPWVEISRSGDESADDDGGAAADDWVDLGSRSRSNDEDEEEEERDIPLF